MFDVLMIRSSAFKTTRVIRQAKELSNSGYKVTILHWERMVDKQHNDNVIKSLDFPCEIATYEKRCDYGKGIFSLIPRLGWFWFIFISVLTNTPKIIHAVDFDSALPVFIASFFKKFKFVYDIADYIETFDSNIPKVIRRVIRYLSGKVVDNSALIILPDENRLVNISHNNMKKVVIVNNAPSIDLTDLEFPSDSIDESALSNKDKLNLFYYGAFNEDRAIRLFLEAASDKRLQNVNFWFAGWGALEKEVQDSDLSNVYYIGRLSQRKVLGFLGKMDCSLIFYDPSYEHNRLASPNKIFEAMALGIPVIVSENTSIDELVLDKNIGYVCKYSVDSIVSLILQLNVDDNAIKSKNLLEIYDSHNWTRSANNLIVAYENL